jgi:hypothetical protein
MRRPLATRTEPSPLPHGRHATACQAVPVPLTFPSHAAAVLPLKMWRPRWFDGVALVVGSAAPDVPYVLGPPIPTYGHTWWGLLLWGVPIGVAGAWLIRWAAPVVAAHLPGFWRDYGVLGSVRHPWYSTAFSAWLGAVSHRLWDEVTHASLPGTSLGIPALAAPALPGVPWWAFLHALSTLLGLIGWTWLTVRIARRGLLRDWHGAPPPVARAPRLFWSTAATCAVAGCIAAVLLPERHALLVDGLRGLSAVAGGLLVAAGAVRYEVAARRYRPGA